MTDILEEKFADILTRFDDLELLVHTALTHLGEISLSLDSHDNIQSANMNALHQRLDVLDSRLTMSLDKVDKVADGIEPHIPEITKMIDDIAANPMFRMLTGGKKK